MSDTSWQLIKTFTEAQGTSGFEKPIREMMREAMEPFVDEIQQDGLGGIFGIKRAKNHNEDTPVVMFASHMDEVGFMVTNINKQGLFNVAPLGGWNPHVVSSQRFTLFTQKGTYPCISSSVPPHLLRGTSGKKDITVDDILFDAGFESAEEAHEYGVRIGDAIVPQSETVLTANKKRIISKAWDNRYGCIALIETLHAIKDIELPYTLVIGANVQEEVGLRGARVSTHQFQPDLFFAVDCSPANDLTGKENVQGRLDDGFLMRIQDPRMITLPQMVQFLRETADAHGIKYQDFISKGGTDAGAAHLVGNGIPSAVIGVPGRYIHTHQTLFSIADYQAALSMIIEVIKTLDKDTISNIRLNPAK
ncbi:glutamyl aminopeptidase [Atopobacter phocae]|uniref:glutamyl aminopeptidase n=1 Tax=Atopobacter phocae TaxID=136492 RepID=UPI00046FA205|nr:glutamyl aminopeptidase [Atopobacter phocae]